MAEQAKQSWKNPITKAHVVGIGIGIVATAIFSFGYPGWYMSRSVAEAQRKVEGDRVHAEYCLASYLSSGVTAEQAATVRTKGTTEQAEIFLSKGHAPDMDSGRACGRALDRLTSSGQVEDAIKLAMAAAAERTARIAAAREAAKENDTKKN